MKNTQVCSWIAVCRKQKTKVETSSLRNLEIMPKNLKESVRSRIPSLYSDGNGKSMPYGLAWLRKQ